MMSRKDDAEQADGTGAELAEARSTKIPTDHAIQLHELDSVGRNELNGIMHNQGQMRSRIPDRIQTLEASAANEDNKPSTREKSRKNAVKLGNLSEHAADVPVSLRSATNARVFHFIEGVKQAHREGRDDGTAWYFKHRKDLAGLAEQHDHDVDQVITSSALMSPLNDPENEKAAAGGLLARRAGDDSPENAKDIRRGGTNVNIKKADAHLNGDNGDEDPIDPISSPKVHSYRNSTRNAIPGPVENEYRERVGHATDVINGKVHVDQTRMDDLFGLKDSREGILDPEGHTAEDTWMNSLTMGQDLDTNVGRANVGKTLASDKGLGLDIPKVGPGGESVHPNADVGSAALLHAYNNEATVRAAEIVGNMTNTRDSQGRSNLPSVAMQEIAWTAGRRRAGRDPQVNAEKAATAKDKMDANKRARENPQGSLF